MYKALFQFLLAEVCNCSIRERCSIRVKPEKAELKVYDLENAVIRNQDVAFYKRLNVPTILAIYISITLLHVKNCTCNFKETFHAYAINT